MVSEDDEVTRFQNVAEKFHGAVDIQQLPIVGAVFGCARLSFLEKNASGCQALSTDFCSTASMAEVGL
jgi:hypothetical protein